MNFLIIFMIMIIDTMHLLNFEGTIMTISKDRVVPSPLPDSWKLKEIFATGIVLGGYLALMTVIFFWLIKETDFFSVSYILLCFLTNGLKKLSSK